MSAGPYADTFLERGESLVRLLPCSSLWCSDLSLGRSEVQDIAAVLEHISLVLELWEKDKAFLYAIGLVTLELMRKCRGWVEVPLTPLCDAQMHDVWYPLCKRKGKDKVSGELRVQITVAPIVRTHAAQYG
jgi:hypothetical protein